MQRRRFLAVELLSSARKVAAHAPSPACRGVGRGPRSIASSSVAMAARARRRRAEPEARMLEQREQRHRRQAVRARPRRRAARTRRPAVSGSASPPESSDRDVPARRAPPRRGARARGPASPARRSCPVVHRLAQRDRDRERLFLGVGGLDHGDGFERGVGVRGEIGCVEALRPSARSRRDGRSASDASRSRPCGAGSRQASSTSSRAMPMRCSSAAWRIADGRATDRSRRPRLADQLPGRVVEIGVEAGQHHGAVRQLRDGREQLRGRRHRAGRAGRDHRAGAALRAAALRPRSAGRAARPARSCLALGEDRRPVLARRSSGTRA